MIKGEQEMIIYKKFLFIGSCILNIILRVHSSNACPLDEAYREGGLLNDGGYFHHPSRSPVPQTLVLGQPLNTDDSQARSKLRHSLSRHVETLKSIQRIREFDPDILNDNPTPASLTTFTIRMAIFEEPFIRQLLDFYSEDSSIRNIMFIREIREPLLKILEDVTQDFHILPKSFRHLADTIGLRMSLLLNVAIKDIFSHYPEALRGLQSALEEIEKIPDRNELSKNTENQLSAITKLAGYYYDKKAIEDISSSLSRSLPLFSQEDSKKQRLAILGILQRTGELLKPVLPLTLNLDTDLPNTKLMLRLRTELAHLTFKRLGELLSDQRALLFFNLKSDLEQLKSRLEVLPSQIPAQPSDEASALDLWHRIVSENHGSLQNARDWVKQEDGKWQGFKELYKFFHPEEFVDLEIQRLKICQQYFERILKKESLGEEENQAFNNLCRELKINRELPVENNLGELENRIQQLSSRDVQQSSDDYSKEVGYFLPCTVDEARLQKLEQEKSKTRKLLNDKAGWLISLKVKNIDETQINAICKKLEISIEKKTRETKIQECINYLENDPHIKQLYDLKEAETKATDGKARKTLQEETSKALDKIIEQILKITLVDKEALEKRRNLKKAQESLKHKLKKIKPLYGWMFQDTASELLDLLNKERHRIELTPITFTYDWLAKPDQDHSPEEAKQFEQLFYKVHSINFITLADKNKHRAMTINSLLRIIDLMREEAHIKTDIRQEQLKETVHKTLQGKLQIMSQATYSMKPKSELTRSNLFDAQNEQRIQEMIVFEQYLKDEKKRDEAQKYLNENVEFRRDLLRVLWEKATSQEVFGCKHYNFYMNELKKADNGIIINYLTSDHPSSKKIMEYWFEQELKNIASKRSQVMQAMLQEIVSEAENIIKKIEDSSVETLDSIKKTIEELKYKFIQTYKKFSQDSLLDKKDPKLLEEQLFNELLAEKRFLIDQFLLESRILSNPLDDIYGLIEKIRSNFSDENLLNVAAHNFLVGFFYESLKEILDYPEISNLKGTVQLRNHYYHEHLGRAVAPRIPGRKTTHMSRDGALSQDIVTITLNIKFILENLKEKLLSMST